MKKLLYIAFMLIIYACSAGNDAGNNSLYMKNGNDYINMANRFSKSNNRNGAIKNLKLAYEQFSLGDLIEQKTETAIQLYRNNYLEENYIEANRWFDIAVKLSPEKTNFLKFEKSKVMFELGKFEAALHLLKNIPRFREDAIDIEKLTVTAISKYKLGRSYKKELGFIEENSSKYDDDVSLHGFVTYHLAWLYFEEAEFAKADSKIKKALELYKLDSNPAATADALFLAGKISIRLNKAKDAKNYLLRALDTYKALGDKKNAEICKSALNKM